MSEVDGQVDIVRAAPSDAAVVHAMMREFAAHDGSPAVARTGEAGWCEVLADDRVTVLIAWLGGEPVGYVSAVRTLHLSSAREIVALDDVYVRPAARNHGVGEVLMRGLAERCPGLAIRWEMEEGNLAAQRFSVRLGARLRRKVVAWREADVAGVAVNRGRGVAPRPPPPRASTRRACG